MRDYICKSRFVSQLFAYPTFNDYICNVKSHQTIYKMDIVTRLKEFINHESVAITQFADNCKIPRPTLSQLLNGRNKKVSDELITKIHEAYPQLSVLWLMFGEGSMLHEESIQPSAPQNNSFFGFESAKLPLDENIASPIEFEKNHPENEIENSDDPTSSTQSTSESPSETPTISFNPYNKKRIVNIIVYYDDNSFESFIPGARK